MGPLWQPKLWDEINKEEYLKHTNCYSYAFNYIDYGEEKLQPGEIHGTKYKETTCDEIIQKMENDYVNDGVEKTSFKETLPKDIITLLEEEPIFELKEELIGENTKLEHFIKGKNKSKKYTISDLEKYKDLHKNTSIYEYLENYQSDPDHQRLRVFHS